MLKNYTQGFVIPRSIEEAGSDPDDPRVLDAFAVIDGDTVRLIGINNFTQTTCILDGQDIVALTEAIIQKMNFYDVVDLRNILHAELKRRNLPFLGGVAEVVEDGDAVQE